MYINLFRAADRLEYTGILAGRLALSKEKVSALFQRGVENSEQAPLQHRLEINHDVPAAYEIQLSKGRIGKHVVGCENNHAPYILGNLILIIALRKIFRQALRGDIVQNVLGENPLSGLLYGFGVHVCGKDLNIPLYLQLLQNLLEQDGNGIGLLAGGASRAPDTDRVLFICPLHNIVNGAVLQFFKKRRVPEKVRHADQDFLNQNVYLIHIVSQQLRIIREACAVRHHHPPFNAPQNRRPFIICKINAAYIFQNRVNMRKRFLVRNRHIVFMGLDDRWIMGKI